MSEELNAWGLLQRLTWQHVLLVLAILFSARLLSFAVRWVLRHFAENAPPRWRLSILRAMPIARLLIGAGAIVVAVPILVEPTFRNVAALIATVGLALAFALKDYASSLVAGLATVMENTYQPGDWIEVGGIYGEVKTIALRAVRIVTPDDTEVIIPHSLLWTASISNASSGSRSLLCVAEFYLHPDHDAGAARRRLAEIAETSSYRKSESPVTVIVLEKPWGTQYRLKAYVKESRDQFLFITDLTIRGKEALRAMGIRFAQVPYAETKQTSDRSR
jgi:small-conductance mechanosensitive channel